MKLLLIGAFFAIFSNVHGNSSYVKKLPFNITGKWYLPNSNSPVFYLHFRDRISWIEADAVCQFHHSQLVTINKPNQFEDVKSYLKEIGYDKKVWIGLQKLYNDTMEWRDGSILTTDEYWKEAPNTENSICVMSSPADNYRWIANPCNGPGTASFICEMPIPKWVKKSACLDAINPSITVTFHPEKTMIKAGTVCQNSDVKYIECHDPGVNEKIEENKKMMREHLVCPSQSNEKPLSGNTDTTTKATKPSSTSRPSTGVKLTTKQILSTQPTPITTSRTVITKPSTVKPSLKPSTIANKPLTFETKSPTETEFTKKNTPIISESSTISLPQEMSFAEEPIRASKPFVEKYPTDIPDVKLTTINTTEPHKSKKNGLNLIPTSQPLKTKPEKATLLATELPKENSSSINLASGPTETSNATPVEESHEVYNSDKDREIFQESVSPPMVKKSVKLDVVENIGNSLKNIASKSSESQEDPGDRTYNIEGTFESNDFSNIEPINVYKKIDLNPLENVDTTVKTNESEKPDSSTQLSKLTTGSSGTSKPSINTTPITTTTDNAQSTTSTPNLIILEARNESSTENFDDKKRSSLLSGADDNDEKNFPSRKRRIINSERHSFYPYFLGRIWG